MLWLLGFFGQSIIPSFPQTGGWIHALKYRRQPDSPACLMTWRQE
jgi:hypothetical protein